MSNYEVKFKPEAKNHCWNKAFDLIKAKTTVLDVGCSYGGFGEALIKYKACEVDGVEPDKGDAAKAAKVLRDVYEGFIEDAFNGKLKSRTYDYIVFLDVIEHLYDPVETLSLVKKHLKPGGQVIFSIPNMAHISVRLMLLGGKFEYGDTGLLDATHLHFYTKQQIAKVFKQAGFGVTVWDYTEATYPETLVRSKLAEFGLEANEAALKKLTAADAQIFQYVGAASPGGGATVKTLQYSPDPQGEIAQSYEKKIQEYEDIIVAKDRAFGEKAKKLEELKLKLSDEDFLASQLGLKTHIKNYLRKRSSKKRGSAG